MIYPLVEELAGLGLAVSRICRVLGIARQPFYRWRGCKESQLEQRRRLLKERVVAIHSADPAFGSRLITDELARQEVKVASHTVWLISHELGIKSITAPRARPRPPSLLEALGLIWLGGSFVPMGLTASGLLTSPNTPPCRASCMCVRSRTCGLTGSWLLAVLSQ